MYIGVIAREGGSARVINAEGFAIGKRSFGGAARLVVVKGEKANDWVREAIRIGDDVIAHRAHLINIERVGRKNPPQRLAIFAISAGSRSTANVQGGNFVFSQLIGELDSVPRAVKRNHYGLRIECREDVINGLCRSPMRVIEDLLKACAADAAVRVEVFGGIPIARTPWLIN